MRKVLSTILIACAMAVAATSLATGATTKHCGTLYTAKCTKPIITTRTLPPSCRKPGSTFTLPNIHVYAIAGIRKITVGIGSTLLYKKTFKGNGTQNYTVKGVKVHTKTLSTGGHTVTIVAKDVNGRTGTRHLRFTVCPPPKFTG
jgi:hypothetical protein